MKYASVRKLNVCMFFSVIVRFTARISTELCQLVVNKSRTLVRLRNPRLARAIVMKAAVLFLLFFVHVACEDYYDLLGIKRDAGDRDIRRAFKKIALKRHPDKNKVNNAPTSTTTRQSSIQPHV